ncbi:MAG: type II toxin-antitoxin system prevent-host-death family antitoxin [Kiritimatiellae bacterium]|nr:type II toxin-antitoxin system prevent-host-death family antitoxin [Kiritimatiellia bacterium]
MIKTLKESKATLSALVDQASKGEEIIITVRGKPKARLCPVNTSPTNSDKAAWAEQVRENWAKYTTSVSDSSSEILDGIREDRF